MQNKIIRKGDKLLRVLQCDEEEALVIDCKRSVMPTWIDISEIVEGIVLTDEELTNEIGVLPAIEVLDKRQTKLMNERFTLISDVIQFVGNEQQRSSIIREIASQNKISKETVRSYLIKYLIYQDKRALVPKKKGQQKELTTDEKNMRWGLNKFFYTKRKNSLRTAYNYLLKEKYCDDEGKLLKEHPSFNQFKYFYTKTKKQRKFIISRQGIKKYQQASRPLLGECIQEYASAPGTAMVDSTVCDIYLVNSSGQIIGRPILTMCVDAYSGLIMGYSLGLEGGIYSLQDMMLNVISDKVNFCKEHNIIISREEWSVSDLPARIVSDKGSEYVGNIFSQLVELGVTLVDLPSYRPELKGIVEKTFDMLQNKMLPHLKGKGTIDSDFQIRNEDDYRLKAQLTLEQFEKILIKSILFCNSKRVIENYPYTQEMLDKQVKPYAQNIWNYGVTLSGCNLIEVSRIDLILTLLPRTIGKFTRKGLKVNDVRYHHDGYAEEYLTGEEVTVAYNKENANSVWLVDEQRGFVEFSIVESRFNNCSFAQIETMKTRQKQLNYKEKEDALQAEIELINQIEMVAADASPYEDVKLSNMAVSRLKEQRKLHKDLVEEAKKNG